MNVNQLISDGVKTIAYIPFIDTPKDNSKAVYNWDKKPELNIDDFINPTHNIAIKPDYNWVDLDFDCDEAKQLGFEYFNPSYLFGRDERGHMLINISDPTKFPITKVCWDKECLIEMRGKGCYSVAHGTLTGPDGEASFKKTDYGKALTFKECRKNFFEIGLLCQLKRGFYGSVNDFIIPIVGEMIFKGIEVNHCTEIMMKFLRLIERQEREAETKKSILAMYRKNTPSMIERLVWTELQQRQVETTLDALANLTKQERTKERQFARLETKTLKEIKETEYPPLLEVCEGILTAGLGFFSAKPKVGKSFLGLALAYAVATGNKFLGLKTTQGCVLYIAYEDSEARIQRRADSMSMDKCESVEFAFKTDKLMDGLEDQLLQWIEDKRSEDKRPILIIVDTYIRSQDGKKGSGTNSYEIDSSKLDRLQRDVLAQDVCCMMITHDKKVEESDKLNNMSGSIAFQGQDFIWHMDKNRTDGSISSTLHVEPRDLEPQEYEIHMNSNFEWENLGTPQVKTMDKVTRQTLEAIEAISEVRGDAKPKEIWDWLLANKPRDGDDCVVNEKTYKYAYNKKIYSLLKQHKIVRGERASSYMLPILAKQFEEDSDDEDLPF